MSERTSRSSRSKAERPGSSRQNLSAAHLERRRMADRESQRAGRERTKNHIRHLEKLVESLQKTEDNDRLGALMEQCQELRGQNEQLMSVISNIGRMCKSIEHPDETQKHPSPSPAIAYRTGMEPDFHQQRLQSETTTADMRPYVAAHEVQPESWWNQSGLSEMEGMHQVPSNPLLSSIDPSLPNLNSRAQAQANPIQTLHTVPIFPARDTATETTAEVVNSILSKAELFTVLSSHPDDDADIAIRAVLNGWNSVRQTDSLDDGWESIRKVDQQAFLSCGLIERLAILHVMRLQLRHVVDPTNENLERLPSFMHPRPTQNLIQHPSMVNYFVWPDLRDFIILSPYKSMKSEDVGKFVSIFVKSIRFQWPYDLCDSFTKNPHSGLYSFTSNFCKQFEDIRSWMLDSDFFVMCPQLIGYIPIHNPGPGRVLGDFLDQGNLFGETTEQEQRAQNDNEEPDWTDVLIPT
ncbi:hypothetical protein V493_05325 [Pseudogymnoascus sp. VKM F-4281 (FW-2241)]|nr:hypothetical protein V493_05325 [Pseudogymnoascus sp. VKM F-4281 (FW-2241)]